MAPPNTTASASLLLGVFSWLTPESLRRRKSIRRLCTLSEDVHLRFVLPGLASDANHSDILSFPVPATVQLPLTGKFLLATAFLRHAVALATHSFIGRTDDDALFNASAIALTLGMLPAAMREGNLVFGVSSDFYMWNERAMEPSCFAYTPRRWELQQRLLANESSARFASCQPSHVGPFFTTKGPLAVFSRPLAAALVQDDSMRRDEARVLANWSGVLRERREWDRRTGQLHSAKRRERNGRMTAPRDRRVTAVWPPPDRRLTAA